MNTTESSRIISSEPGSVPLSYGKHELYARHRAAGLSPTEAVRRAGGNPRNGVATRFERNREVQQRLAWLCRHETEVAMERRRYAEERLTLVHDMDIGEFYEDAQEPVINRMTGDPVLDDEGRPLMRWTHRLKPFFQLTREQRLCIESLTYTEKGRPNLRLYSKEAANNNYRKLHGLDMPAKVAPTNQEGTGPYVAAVQWLKPVDDSETAA